MTIEHPKIRHSSRERFPGSFARACERGSFRVVHYSIQRDHVHLIVEAKGREALGRGMKSIAARVARAANRVFERTGPVLKERYHLHVLRKPREVRSALRYVLLNARKHSRKQPAARAQRLDPASSGRWFDGWRRGWVPWGPLDVPGVRQRSVAPARTWLLRVGWRRHGLIDPGEVFQSA